MNITVPLPPHLDQFVHKQLANGRFQSEGDVVCAALRLLENQELKGGFSERPATEPQNGTQERLGANPVFGSNAAHSPAERRSPRGILADIRSYISPDDIKDARSEMWSGFPHGQD